MCPALSQQVAALPRAQHEEGLPGSHLAQTWGGNLGSKNSAQDLSWLLTHKPGRPWARRLCSHSGVEGRARGRPAAPAEWSVPQPHLLSGGPLPPVPAPGAPGQQPSPPSVGGWGWEQDWAKALPRPHSVFGGPGAQLCPLPHGQRRWPRPSLLPGQQPLTLHPGGARAPQERGWANRAVAEAGEAHLRAEDQLWG